ncbi:PREDICTED: organic cation transporter 1-like [Priapulus caudatus]|uniref:Organic cation transporter 1-like n=1 Tax=Priapulus caudatus TaxID=37621 RepID=A0ABM1DSX5_PRICU|nr:PREDICTED: organic cation transporter 1-like [Priapulus caudatus]
MSMFSAGGIFGALLFGWIGDRFGRRPGFFSTWAVMLVFGVATAFAPEIISFTVFRTFVGATVPVIYQAPFVLSLELAAADKHSLVSSMIWMTFVFGAMALPLIAWLSLNWRHIALITAAPLAVFGVFYWIMPESPRWLLTHGQKQQADKIIRRIAKVNKRNVSDEMIARVKIPADHTSPSEQGNLLTVLKFRYLMKKFVVILVVWVTNAMVYIGQTYAAGTSGVIGENPYLVFFFSAAVEGMGYFASWPIMQLLGRRWAVFINMSVCAAASFLITAVPAGVQWLSITIAMIAKFTITASFTVIYVFGAELFPTSLRSVSIGTCGFFSNAGVMLAPQIMTLAKYSNTIPMLIFGGLAALGAALCLYLPETLNEPLPETAEEANRFGRDNKYCSCYVRRQHAPVVNRDVEMESPFACESA